jgi:hypothetical protein
MASREGVGAIKDDELEYASQESCYRRANKPERGEAARIRSYGPPIRQSAPRRTAKRSPRATLPKCRTWRRLQTMRRRGPHFRPLFQRIDTRARARHAAATSPTSGLTDSWRTSSSRRRNSRAAHSEASALRIMFNSRSLQFGDQRDRSTAGGSALNGATARLQSHACDLWPERHNFPQ